MSIPETLNEGDPLVAIVGATDDPTKYGSVIYRDLKAKGYRVVPVNRHRETVCGDRAYPSLEDLPQPPDIVNIVVPPEQTLAVLRSAERLGYRRVWLQPGAADAEVHAFLEDGDLDYLADACIMVRSRVRAAR